MWKRLSIPKLVYIGLWLRLEIDLVDPTHKKRETHMFVAIKVYMVVIRSTSRFLRIQFDSGTENTAVVGQVSY